jgi:AmmeMemoRadiSam system protein B
MRDVRPAAVAGSFYPESPTRLAATGAVLSRRRGGRRRRGAEGGDRTACRLRLFGPVAATAYARLASLRDTVTRVVLLGPTHRVPVRGLAVPQARAFATPLGEVCARRRRDSGRIRVTQVIADDDAHAAEHALEVQLPFLQSVLGTFTLVPLAVGRATPDDVAAVLDGLWGGTETLIVVSSDLSHYHTYADAQRIDRDTADAILALSPNLDHEQACGAVPINGLLTCARRRGLEPVLLDLRNSGDTAGDRLRVVGYASFAFYRPWNATLTWARRCSPSRARRSAPSSVLAARRRRPTHPFLRPPRRSSRCAPASACAAAIGSVEARRPLGEDVRANAIAAAFSDPRFPPMAAHECAATTIEVSLLGPSEALPCASEDEAVARLRPGIDGVMLHCDRHRAIFLPQVWQQFVRPP